jgi:hypothetical protein
MDLLTQLEERLKCAAEARQYAEVDRLTLEYGDAARTAIGVLPAGAPEVAQVAQRVLNTLERARLIVLTGRAQTACELRRIPFLERYLPAAPARPAVRIDV